MRKARRKEGGGREGGRKAGRKEGGGREGGRQEGREGGGKEGGKERGREGEGRRDGGRESGSSVCGMVVKWEGEKGNGRERDKDKPLTHSGPMCRHVVDWTTPSSSLKDRSLAVAGRKMGRLVCVSVCLPVCLSVCLPACQSITTCTHLSSQGLVAMVL